jgi:hypothetical protein
MPHIELPRGLPGIAAPLGCVGSLTVRTMTSADEAPAIDTVVLAWQCLDARRRLLHGRIRWCGALASTGCAMR